MHSPRTDRLIAPVRQVAALPQRLNVRLVLALASVVVVALLVSRPAVRIAERIGAVDDGYELAIAALALILAAAASVLAAAVAYRVHRDD